MTLLWRETVEPDEAVDTASVPAFAAGLRDLLGAVDVADTTSSAHERRLVQRVRAALAAFEAGWTVLGDDPAGSAAGSAAGDPGAR